MLSQKYKYYFEIAYILVSRCVWLSPPVSGTLPGHQTQGQPVARSTRSSTLETRSARFRLPTAKKPVFVKIGPGVGLGYRRNQTAGTWVARVADGKGGNWTKAIGSADDLDDADGDNTLDFWQAQDKARTLGRAAVGDTEPAKPATLGQALDAYEADLKTRGGDIGNVARVRMHLPAGLLDKVWRCWRRGNCAGGGTGWRRRSPRRR